MLQISECQYQSPTLYTICSTVLLLGVDKLALSYNLMLDDIYFVRMQTLNSKLWKFSTLNCQFNTHLVIF